MALIFFLKEKEKAVIASGNGETLSGDIAGQLNDGSNFIIVKTLDETSTLIPKDSISHIEEITEKELARRKTAYEKEQKLLKQRRGQPTHPSLIIPQN